MAEGVAVTTTKTEEVEAAETSEAAVVAKAADSQVGQKLKSRTRDQVSLVNWFQTISNFLFSTRG